MANAANQYTTASIYGLCKSPELSMNNDDLHALVYRITKKESIKQLSDHERRLVVIELVKLKELCKTDLDQTRSNGTTLWASQKQLYQIGKLEKELGWDNNPDRLKGFMKKYSHKENLSWLTEEEASNLIEGLKGCKRNFNGNRRKVAK